MNTVLQNLLKMLYSAQYSTPYVYSFERFFPIILSFEFEVSEGALITLHLKSKQLSKNTCRYHFVFILEDEHTDSWTSRDSNQGPSAPKCETLDNDLIFFT